MKLTTLTLIAILISGCTRIHYAKPSSGDVIVNYEIVTIDGCEYIATPGYVGYTLTHKGNCSNPAHYDPLRH